jgi:hypothetical protein
MCLRLQGEAGDGKGAQTGTVGISHLRRRAKVDVVLQTGKRRGADALNMWQQAAQARGVNQAWFTALVAV